MATAAKKQATIYRMAIGKSMCPHGLKALHLLKSSGFQVEDQTFKTREETDAFKAAHDVKSTPQVFIDGRRIGGNVDLRRYLGKKVRDPKAVTYRPVIAVFAVTALMALATSYGAFGEIVPLISFQWFIAFSMCVLAILKLRDIESFSGMFLGYDLLARRWVPYAYIYPFAEAAAGILMISRAFPWVSIPIALFIGGVGAVSVIKAVYMEKRDLKCACVGGDSNVPLGFLSLTENVMMVVMALVMLAV
jgi:glutaredoxin